MIIKTLNRSEAESAMKDWISSYPEMPVIERTYLSIRRDIQKINKGVRDKFSDTTERKDYCIDVYMGILLYDYLWHIPGFNLRAAANDDFWRYLSIKVVPDVVAERWGYKNDSHYWSKPSRIWFRSIWWYIHLSWQGDMKTTARVLMAPCFTTDSILNLEERTGRKGTFINVYRYIMYYYSHIPVDVLNKFNRNTNKKQDDLFRIIMKLNTARVMVVEPALFLGGEKEYVRSLFRDAGVPV